MYMYRKVYIVLSVMGYYTEMKNMETKSKKEYIRQMKEKLKYLHVLSYGKDINQKLSLLKTKICGDVVYIEIGMTYQQYLKLDIRDEKNNMIRVKDE